MKVSVVIPIYKVEQYLQECVDSVLAQTYSDIEVILVDDGSPDNCPSICDEYANRDSRIKVIHKPNGGLSDARNAGTALATGEYIVYLDSDDCWFDNNAIAKALPLLERKPDMVFFGYRVQTEDGRYIQKKGMPFSSINGCDKSKALDLLISSSRFTISACSKFIRLELIKDNDIRFKKNLLSEDIDWCFQVLMVANVLLGMDEVFYNYRRREGSITATIGKKNIESLLSIMEEWSVRIESSDENERIKYLLLGYLNFEYYITMGLFLNMAKEEQILFEERFDNLSWLMKYDVNKKTHIAAALFNLLGKKRAKRLFSLYIRNKFKFEEICQRLHIKFW